MKPSARQSHYTPIIPNKGMRWLVVALSWCAYGLFMTTQSYYLALRQGGAVDWAGNLPSEMTYAFFWLLLTPVVMRLAWRYPVEPPHRISRASLHLLISLVLAIFQKVVYHAAFLNLTATPEHPFSWTRVERGMFLYLDYGLMIYWGLLLLRHSYDYFQRYHRNELEKSLLESQLMRAQLHAMKMQLQPHFLFNTLNAISVLIQKNPVAARAMLGKLSELLRLTLERNSTQEIRLCDEMEMLDCYLHIEHTRFEDRLLVEKEIEAGTLDALVPSFLLQPIVENAMRHGVACRRERTRVAIRAARLNGSLRLEVSDTGPGIDFSAALKEGIGLSTTRQRLRQLYGEESRIELQNAESGGLTVTMTLPFRPASTSAPRLA